MKFVNKLVVAFGLLVLTMCIIAPSVSASGSGSLTVSDVKSMLPSGIDALKVTLISGDVSVLMPFKDNLFGRGYILIGTQTDATDIFKALFKDNRVNSITVNSQIPLTDKYGNTETGIGTTYTMESTTAAKINWDNFQYTNLNDVADYVYIHPALRDEP